MDEIFDKLQAVVDRYDELNELISDPEVIADTQRFMKLSKEEGELRDTVAAYNKYKKVTKQLDDDEEMLRGKIDDAELETMVKDEISDFKDQKAKLEEQLKVMLLPKDPNDEKNIIMEIHGAAGGDEGSLFAADLFSMYSKYAERQGWKVEVIDKNETEVGGFKEIVLMISGDKVYSKLKYENGAHRVQRVPVTESAGRVHTSTATVGVMPEEEDVDIDIDPKDIRVDVYRSSGAGGQHINKTSSAVRMTHLPTGIVVAMQDERSQQQNRAKAMKILKARVYDYYAQQEQDQYNAERKSAIGTGDRSERIRTYNYPQNRVTDHRIGLTLNKLDRIMNGELDEIIDALILSDQAKKLENLTNETN
ncbi:MAG: peptide chain release factor 1 [Lentilactobacillus diolivorans]|jgi:peptide chain release factor 1|uniref:Peptide chain release factor 1 n=2 Tax=Lentilactobacillus diolivorans TaxID=179838 RepID=A0A0R1SIV7_9LACO|nr:peptide chain release factor 1 [Lentilactobacillus diolivorans]RRG04455.1 MAG: peptide chain release factor 1 [Lactobacillus sp.]KRL69036.1 peptide chain release factor 1 [Lentilactobacillus diolivorans DSM 14421]MCH4164670.1 peptide chain release factor 1 [Lentilactobacillus diolivorans]MDH5106598.1 peptide chain release factor 1 [Lentilactobacillus diolivorans]GEP22517.1 peptide chain release factor 1 [Lentilactobacillus diolivorans]